MSDSTPYQDTNAPLKRDYFKSGTDLLSVSGQISSFGRKVVAGGLVEGNFGNISIRTDVCPRPGSSGPAENGCASCGDFLTITKTGTSLDELDEESVITLPVTPDEKEKDLPNAAERQASSELKVHRSIYRKTNAKAVLHVHAPYAVTMSILEAEKGRDRIVPVDSEGILFLKEIPIVRGGIGTDELAKNASEAFEKKKVKVVVVHGHGTFAVGETLGDAYIATVQAEHAAQIAYLCAVAKHLYRKAEKDEKKKNADNLK